MKSVTVYSLQRRVKELEREKKRLESDLYSFRSASSEIYDGLVSVLSESGTTIKISWLLGKLKRAWRP